MAESEEGLGHSEEDGNPTASLSDAGVTIGGQIGRYTLLSILGEGGFGIVYLAEQKHPIKRQVAIKVLKPGMDSRRVVARFEAERQALALLDHPNIAHVFDASSTEGGRPYFVMEYIKGLPITDYCDYHKLGIDERLRMFMQVCQAVQHAHQKGIIHRDLKPSNVIVTPQDGKPFPKIIDFGIAKAIGMPLTDKTVFTMQGQLIGTPEYISPEQANFQERDIDTRTDIYSLGVVLYELIAGVLPFESHVLREAGYTGIQRIIREQEPPRPSAKLSGLGQRSTEISEKRRIEPATLVKRLHDELEWIPLKAIRKERDERYATASDLAGDIQNYLVGNPLRAGPETTRYRMRKYIRKHKGPVTAAAIIAGLVLAGFFIITGMYLRSEMLKVDLEKQLYYNRMALADASKVNNVRYARQLLDSCPIDMRGWEWNWLDSNLDQSQLTLRGHQRDVYFVCFSPDGKQVASSSIDHTIKIWDPNRGCEVRTLNGHQDSVISISFSPDGKRIASGSKDKTIKIWDTDSGREERTLRGHQDGVCSVSFSSDGKRIVSGSHDNTIKIWDIDSGLEERTLRGHQSIVCSVCFSPDNKQILSGSSDSTLRIWDTDSGHEVRTLNGHHGVVQSVSFSPDGKRIASGSNDNTIKIWDVDSGREERTLRGHESVVSSVFFSPDNKRIVSGSFDNTIKIWDPNSDVELRTLSGHQGPVWSACFSPDGKRIVSGCEDSVKIWDLDSNRQPSILNDHQGAAYLVGISPDGMRIASGSQDNTIKIWDADSGRELLILNGHQNSVFSVSFSPDGKRIASGSEDGTIIIWDTDSGTRIRTLSGHRLWVVPVSFSPDGRWIVSGGGDNTIKIWDADSGREVRTLNGHQGSVSSVSFSSDGKRVASSSWDHTMKIWDADSGTPLLTLRGHPDITSVYFCPDGKRIVSGGTDKTIRIWDAGKTVNR